MSKKFDLRDSVIRKNNVVKESVLKIFLFVRYLVVASNEGYHVFEFLCQDQGPRNIQICVLVLLGEKNDKVVYLGFH